MGDWRQIYFNAFETFYDQDGIGELTIPAGTSLYWRHDSTNGQLDRVEADFKDADIGHPEVFEGRYSAALMWTFSTGSAALVSDPIYEGIVGLPTLIRASYMHVFDDGGQGGGVLGIVYQDNDPFESLPHEMPSSDGNPFEDPAISWGHWVSTRDIDDREWATLESPLFTTQPGYYRWVLLFNSDLAIPGTGHFDAVSIVQESPDSPDQPPTPQPPPSTGAWRVVVYDGDGNEVTSAPFAGPAGNAQIRALAQQIVDLSR